MTSSGDVSSSLELYQYMNILATCAIFYIQEDALKKADSITGFCPHFLNSKFLSYPPQQCKLQTLLLYTHCTATEELQTRPNIFICMKLSLLIEIMTKKIQKWTQGPEKHCPSWHCETHPLSWMMHTKEATVDKKWIRNLSSVLFLAVLVLTRTMQCPGLQWKHNLTDHQDISGGLLLKKDKWLEAKQCFLSDVVKRRKGETIKTCSYFFSKLSRKFIGLTVITRQKGKKPHKKLLLLTAIHS